MDTKSDVLCWKWMVVFCLLGFCLQSRHVAGQEPIETLNADSMLVEISKIRKPAEKAEKLLLLGNYWAQKDPAKARDFALQAERIGQETGSNKILGAAKLIYGQASIKENDLETAESIYNEAITLLTGHDTKRELSVAYLNLGLIAQQKNNAQVAIHYYDKSIDLKQSIRDTIGLGKVYLNMGTVYYFKGDYDVSATWYLKALKILEETGQALTAAKTLNNIGNIYMVTGDQRKAMYYYRKGMAIRERLNDRKGVALVLNNMGSVFYSSQQYDSAIYYFNKSIEIKREFNDLFSIAGTLSNIGSIYRALKDFDQAGRYYREAMAIREKLDNHFELASAYFNLAEFLLDQGNRGEAYQYLLKSQKIAEEQGYQRILISVYQRLALYHEAKGDYRKAYEYQKKFQTVKETEYKESYQKSMEEIEKYRVAEQEKLNDLLKHETQIQALQIEREQIRRMIILGSSIILILLLGLTILILYRRNRRKAKMNKQLMDKNLEIQRLQEEAILAKGEFERILATVSDLITTVKVYPEKVIKEAYFSPAVEAFTGYPPQEFMERPEKWAEMVHPDDVQLFSVLEGQIFDQRGKRDHTLEFRIIHKNGEVHWLQQCLTVCYLDDGSIQIDNVIRDITARKEIEIALVNSEYLYRSTIDSLTEHHIHVIDPTFTIRVFNKAFQQLNNRLGLPKEAVGMNLFDVYPFLGERVKGEYLEVMNKGTTLVTQDAMVVSGHDMHTETYKVPVIRNEKVTKVITIMKDVTEEVKAREKLIKSEERYRLASISKDKFFSVIAHDLMSPFNALLGFSGLLHDLYDEYSDEERKSQAGRILELSELIYKMAENLLFWSRSQTGRIKVQIEPVELKGLISDQIEIFKPLSQKKKIKISTSLPKGMITVTDPNLFSIIIRNLISNAIKFTPHGGFVKIASRVYDHSVEVTVKDTGMGIPQELMENLWIPGHNVKRPGTDRELGTGLGLMICKEFIDHLQGTIGVQSTLGEGSVFTVILPYVPDEKHHEK